MNLPGKLVGSIESTGIVCIQAGESDIDAIGDLILEEGPNEWNHLPPEELREHLDGIATDSTRAIYAYSKPEELMVGAVTYVIGQRYPELQPSGRGLAPHGYIAEAVAHACFRGVGIAPTLLGAAIRDLTTSGMQEVYAMRHADNKPSQRMMEKAGMTLVTEFDDPEIRPTGSRKTAVMRYLLEV